jgi:hypothetical protein
MNKDKYFITPANGLKLYGTQHLKWTKSKKQANILCIEASDVDYAEKFLKKGFGEDIKLKKLSFLDDLFYNRVK